MHQCQRGLKDPNGEFVMKPTHLVPSSPMIAAGMSLRCKGDHVHAEVQWRGQGMSFVNGRRRWAFCHSINTM